MSTHLSSSTIQRRDDIQGIRVIGALLVFSFHVFFSGVSGGVDVFFVISGYFMAANAVKRGQLARPPLLSFYRNFLSRVAPQAILALVGSMALLFFFTSPMVWSTNLRDIGASALYLENVRLIQRGQDYLARSESLTLVQHFWAVALIGQTYFLWPLLLRMNKALVRLLGICENRMLAILISVLSLVSFCWCLYSTASTPASAYFDLFARFWEFGCGVLLGLQGIARSRTKPVHAAALSWLGLALLGSCGFLIGSSQAFPGYAALWPVSAALLLIRYGSPGTRFNAGWLLSRPQLARWGEVSFGVYLWHWPLYAVYANSSNHPEGTPLAQGIGLLLLSIACALFCKRAVDWCLSARPVSSSTTLVPIGFLSLLLMISSSSEFARQEIAENGRSWDRDNLRMAGHIAPGPFSVRDDNAAVYRNGCHQNGTSEKLNTCSFGNPKAMKKIVLVGGSHSAHWLPTLVLHAEKEGWQIISMTKSGCLFADPDDEAVFAKSHDSCATWNESAMRAILAIKPDLVVTLATRYLDAENGRVEYVPEGYLARFRELESHRIRTVALRDNPWMRKDIPVCAYSPLVTDKNICGDKRSHVLNDAAYSAAIKHIPKGVRVIDLTPHFCDRSHCWAVKHDIVIYRDSNHITASYAERISPALRNAVADVLATSSYF